MKQAVIFPGQGSQYPNMGLSLYQSYQKSKKILDAVDSISGVEVTKAIFSSHEEELKDTSIQQLAILAVSLAAYQQVRDGLGDIAFFAGLSLGEYSCLYAAEVLSLEDVVNLVKVRAQAMQRAAKENPSSMFAVIGVDPGQLDEKKKKLGFYVANLNAPSQVVISVSNRNKEEIASQLEGAGLRVVELGVSGGFHSPFIEPAQEDLRRAIEKICFSDAKIPIVSNVDALACTESSRIKENLLAQLVQPVLWADSVRYMAKEGVGCFYEVGPSKVLKGLIRKIDKSLKVTNIGEKQDIEGLDRD